MGRMAMKVYDKEFPYHNLFDGKASDCVNEESDWCPLPPENSEGALKLPQPLPHVVVVIGAQWGDEGKGKLVDALSATADFTARFNGGNNAGHTVVVNGTQHALHLLPCGVLHKRTLNIIGHGVVVHMKSLLEEVELIKAAQPDVLQRLYISSRAHLLFDIHKLVDKEEEERRAASSKAIGTTLRGIGPCYATKAGRLGVRVGELLNFDRFKEKYERLVEDLKNRYQIEFDHRIELENHKTYSRIFRERIADTVSVLHQAIGKGKRILLEGANATLLDIDLGTYPYVTSTSTTVGAVCTGLGISPRRIGYCVGVVKAYATRVGEGPFPTEIFDSAGDHIRTRGAEFGTTTGRPRRCGWLDITLLLYSSRINAFDCLNLTKLDVLTGLKEVQLCIAYKDKSSGKLLSTHYQPYSDEEYGSLVPVYEVLPGWGDPIHSCRTFDELPLAARNYVRRIEELSSLPCRWIGVGSDRLQIISVY